MLILLAAVLEAESEERSYAIVQLFCLWRHTSLPPICFINVFIRPHVTSTNTEFFQMQMLLL
jgi:hypothetical protein